MGGSHVQGTCPRSESLQFVLSYKRLESGRFRPSFLADGRFTSLPMEAAELALIVEGIDLAGARRRRRWQPGQAA